MTGSGIYLICLYCDLRQMATCFSIFTYGYFKLEESGAKFLQFIRLVLDGTSAFLNLYT